MDALTAVVRAKGKRGAPCGGPVTVSALISSVTFKLSLEAAAAAGHVRRALAAGEEFPPPGAGDREGGPRGVAPRGGTRTWGGGSRARRPGARHLEYLEGRGWEEVISATCELGLCKWKKKTAAYPKCQVKSGSL